MKSIEFIEMIFIDVKLTGLIECKVLLGQFMQLRIVNDNNAGLIVE